ncbi:hypothetical protein TIFTF001_028444 [Ficus carica]|uniref:Uncharacterized protein n=1 Tax=Ficus carica TaxID=3494 RepID=A0AA88DQ92_FICCA|nr:hypothetical protein TIFTF001_028444 [Ficus carica]
MLSWTSADNVKFDAVMSTLTAIGEKHPKCSVMMPTDEELKEPYVAQLYLKNHMVVPQAPQDLKKGQKKSRKLMPRVIKLLYNLNDNVDENPTTTYHVSCRHKRNVKKDDSDALKTDSDDLRFGSQNDVFIDFDIGVVAVKGVKVAIKFLNADKIPKQKRSRFSRLRQERSGPVVEIGSPTQAPTKINYALPRGLSDESPRDKLEEFMEWIKK